MTVKELIEKLKLLPEDRQVLSYNDEIDYYGPIQTVTLKKIENELSVVLSS